MKIHYTFDRDSSINCLARWPFILQIQTIPLDERNSIGVTDLKTCLQAIAQCSPELVGDSEMDYTVYAYDYSEPETPLVGQGMFGPALAQGENAAPSMVTGRVTKNLLAIFGNGIKETLEVKLKLTAVPKVTRTTPAVHAPTPTPSHLQMASSCPPNLAQSTSSMSEATEWNAFVQSNPNLGHNGHISISSPVSAPLQPLNSAYGSRDEVIGSNYQGSPMNTGSRPGSRPGSRTGSAEPNSYFSGAITTQPSTLSQVSTQPQDQDRPAIAPAPVPIQSQPQSRPASRPSSRASTGRPRGRPRKKPLQGEGSTSGYEDGTDGDEPLRGKKRAKITKVERSNTATFGSAPESLRVAASTSGSLRNFRPISLGGEAVSGNHLQEVPRAPTPVPPHRSFPGPPQSQNAPPSHLRRQTTSNLAEQNTSYANSYLDVNRSMSFGPDARSPTESLGPSPSQYSEGPSPADIGSSPPVPRSVMYPSARSSPAPSSPILPPMRMPQVDSGFMSGGLDGSRLGDEENSKAPTYPVQAPATEKPKSKPKPRKSRAKKQFTSKVAQSEPNSPFIIQTETPGPPELLPTTSIYNPPNHQPPYNHHKQPEDQATPPTIDHPAFPQAPTSGYKEPSRAHVLQPESNMPMTIENMRSPDDMEDLERALMNGLEEQNHQYFTSLATASQVFGVSGTSGQHCEVKGSIEQADNSMNPPPAPRTSEEATEEADIPPMVPASDPGFTHSCIMDSEAAHPQTDAVYNKNAVKKQSIKQRLEEAIACGQMPPFCTNCGAVETPTWRKTYKQEQKGAPSFHVYSDKPGCVTAINILTRDDRGNITSYDVVKKSLGPDEDKSAWKELILCNPCGIWFSKWKQPRPAAKWEKDQQRLGQTRKRKDQNEKAGRAPRPRKPRTKSGTETNLTSDACLMTDPLGFESSFSPKEELPNPFESVQFMGNGQQGNNDSQHGPGSTHSRASTHSRGSGKSAGSPIAVEDEFGATRRLLFPSPRKEGEQKVLGEVAVNIVHTAHDFRGLKEREGVEEKENAGFEGQNDMTGLFGTPARPSTPPPKLASSGSFKTPNRLTPSHRPVTRSVSKSVRSGRSIKSPSQALASLQRTPSRTPRSNMPSSALVRRSPRVAGLPSHLLDDGHHFDSPFTKSINQLLSEANDFMGSELDLSNLHHMDGDGHLGPAGQWDFGNMLSTDGVMPSSPPVLRHGTQHVSFASQLSYDPNDADIWKHLNAVGMEGADNIEVLEKQGV